MASHVIPSLFQTGLDGLLLPGHKHSTDPTLSSEQPEETKPPKPGPSYGSFVDSIVFVGGESGGI